MTFKLHRIEGYICSIFIAEHPQGLLLLDGGMNVDVPLIEDYCTRVLRRPVSDILLTFVTHMHPDHSGGATVLRKRYKIPIAAHREVDLWYAGAMGNIQYKIDCILALYLAIQNKRKPVNIFSDRIIDPDFFIEDNQPLPHFKQWRAIHAPGHTTHDMALHNKKHGILYVGDIVVKPGGRRSLPLPVVSYELMRKSYKKLGDLKASQVLLAHGRDSKSSYELFKHMLPMLDKAPSPMMKNILRLSICSPVVWKMMKKDELAIGLK